MAGSRALPSVYDTLAVEYALRSEQFRDKGLFLVGPMSAYLRATFPKMETIVLDVGCGVGLDCALLAKEGITAVGIDSSLAMIQEAQKVSPETFFVHSDFLAYNFSSSKFHGVFAKAILHLLDDTDAAAFLEKFRKIIQPNGLLYLSVSCGDDHQLRLREKVDYSGQPKRLKREWSLVPLLTLLRSAGFGPIYWNEHWDVDRSKKWLDVWSKRLGR